MAKQAMQRILDLFTKREGQQKAHSTESRTQERLPDEEDDEDEEVQPADPAVVTEHTEDTKKHHFGEAKGHFYAKKPIIFICDDPYSRGLKGLRHYCHHFKLERNQDSVIERLKQICEAEGVRLEADMCSKVATAFDNDISACINFLDLIISRKELNRQSILSLLASSQTSETQNKNYFELMKQIFNKNSSAAMFKTGEL